MCINFLPYVCKHVLTYIFSSKDALKMVEDKELGTDMEIMNSHGNSSVEQKASTSSSSHEPPKGVPIEWCDINNGMLHRKFTSGDHYSWKLQEGSHGFAVAIIDGIEVKTEMPNLVLQSSRTVYKKPAMNTKAAMSQGPVGPDDEADADEKLVGDDICSEADPTPTVEGNVEDQSQKEEKQEKDAEEGVMKDSVEPMVIQSCPAAHKPYKLEKYRKQNSIGVRRKFDDKKQVFAFGGKTCKLSFTELEHIGDEVIQKLQTSAYTEDEARVWAKGQVEM